MKCDYYTYIGREAENPATLVQQKEQSSFDNQYIRYLVT